jgi:TonB-dependent receptor
VACAAFGVLPAAGAAFDPAPAPTVVVAPDPAPVPTVAWVAADHFQTVLFGVRPSLASAQETKRARLEMVDSVVATDIQKLPDVSVSDALSRVTGVQVARDRGEGGVVAIRGLTQMVSTLNGREVFTAGAGRNLDFTDVPSELLSRVDVYKTASADLLEGGIGGLVDLRTRRPFDFKRGHAAGSARLIYASLAEEARPQVSFLASDRWRFSGGRHLGALVSVAYQDRPYREDLKSAGNPIARSDLVPGTTVTVPNGTSETTSVGTRRRLGGYGIVQARPSERTEVYADGSWVEFRTRQISHQINATTPPASSDPNAPAFEPGSVTLFPGTRDVRSITWRNAPVSVLSFARDTLDRTYQLGAGGSWTGDRLSVRTDVSRTHSVNRLDFSGFFLSAQASQFSQDVSPRVPRTGIAGTDLLDPASFRVAGVAYRVLPYEGELDAARLDADYRLDLGPLRKVGAGVRVARRRADNGTGLIWGDTTIAGGLAATSVPGHLATDPYVPFFPGSTSIGPHLVGNADVLRDQAGLRSAFGVGAPVPTAGDPAGTWQIREDTLATYGQLGLAWTRVDGSVGLRVIRTRETVSGHERMASTGAVEAIDVGTGYTDWLPSLTLRCGLGAGVYVRGAASRTITRPNFDSLSPSLVLNQNSINPSLNQGSSGNPALRPVRSDNLDLAVEGYFGTSTSVYVAGFLKEVDGFILTSSAPEEYDGVTYQVSRPRNANRASIRGAEVGYQQFYSFLPGVLRGLGLQANYTLVWSETRDPVLGGSVALQNLSKHSANLVGMYELGPVSARAAFNWRSRFLSGATSIVNVGTLPVYTRPYGWLDASMTYRLGAFSVALEGVNLLQTIRSSEYGGPTHPQNAYLNDVQVSLTVAVRT